MESVNIELQLWEYIDGLCDTDKKTKIEHLLATDSQWQSIFQQLSALHTDIAAEKELEQPSMRFTKNVMDAIAQTSIAAPVGRYINLLVVRIIAACFIIAITMFLAYAVFMNIQQPDGSLTYAYGLTKMLFSHNAVVMLMSVNVLTLLLLCDALLRKKKIV